VTSLTFASSSAASPEQAAAIVAAIERFTRDAAPVSRAPAATDGWHAAAILEGVSKDPSVGASDAWLGAAG